MKKSLAIILTFLMILSFAACGNNSASSSGNASSGSSASSNTASKDDASETNQNLGANQTVGNISLMVPDGWAVIPGDAGGIENDDSLFLKESEDATEFLWIKIMNEDSVKSSLESNSEADITPFTTGGNEWTGKVNMITTTTGSTNWLVTTYGYEGFTDDVIQAVLGSLQAA